MVIIRFSCKRISFKIFQEAIPFSFEFQVLYMFKEIPEAILSRKFWPIPRKLCYRFYLARNKTVEIMKEVCEVGPNNLRKSFRVEDIFLAQNVSRYFAV